MEDTREIILEKLESAFRDMDAHSYNNYIDDSEYSVIFTVKELRWLYNELRLKIVVFVSTGAIALVDGLMVMQRVLQYKSLFQNIIIN